MSESLAGFVYLRHEPAQDPDALSATLSAVLRDARMTPAKVDCVEVGGRAGRSYKFTVDRFRGLVDASQAGSVAVFDRARSALAFELTMDLRQNPALARGNDFPLKFWMVAEFGPAERVAMADAIATLLHEACSRFDVLHGGAASFREHVEATIEASCIFIDSAQRRPEFVERVGEDMMLMHRFWKGVRRAYPWTVLGPELVERVGGIEAVRSTGVADVEEIHGSLLVQVVRELAEPTDPEFLRQAKQFRQLLWPHSIKNPADARDLDTEEI